jgi:hypothetical protein
LQETAAHVHVSPLFVDQGEPPAASSESSTIAFAFAAAHFFLAADVRVVQPGKPSPQHDRRCMGSLCHSGVFSPYTADTRDVVQGP